LAKGKKILVMVVCRNSLDVVFYGKSTHTKRGKVVDYYEVHVIGLVHTKPNSIDGLPPLTLNRNQVVTVNPPKKTKELFRGCTLEKRGKIVSRDRQKRRFEK